MPDFDHNAIVSYIWGIANDVLRDRFVRGKYRDVILPMTVLRRSDAVSESTKKEVLSMAQSSEGKRLKGDALKRMLCSITHCGFYNTSPYTMADLARPEADFLRYLRGFLSDVQEILTRFDFYNVTFPKLMDVRGTDDDNGTPRSEILTALLGKYLSPTLNLSPFPRDDGRGNIIPGSDNHAMGTLFEELLRRFNEENNQEAGEHFTPRDIVSLMADIIFEPIIQLPEKIFYNTGIAIYIWVLTNRKKENMRGKVQLIDASAWCRPLRKTLGVKSPDAPVLVSEKDGTLIPDPELRESGRVPLSLSVDEFLRQEVPPYAPDAFVPNPTGKIGYEVSFNRYFYKPVPIRSVADIVADIRALDADCDAILNSVIEEEVPE